MGIFNKKTDYVAKMNERPRTTKVGKALSFGATEAYKLLRTNLMFSIPETDVKCKVIGVTSPLESEGKSTTIINLGYTIAETGKKVLIVDCDLRKPSIGRYLSLKTVPGVSNVLAGMNEAESVVINSGVHENLYIAPSGDIPPNPSELIGSAAMEKTIDIFSEKFDYILIDLPPVNAVADALVASKFLLGMVVVVAQDYCIQGALNETVRQLEFLQIKVLGFVMTKGSGLAAKYGKYTKYGKYRMYRRYSIYSRYGYGRKYRSNSAYKYGGYYGASNSKSKLPDKVVEPGKKND